MTMADKFPSAFTSGTVTHNKRVAVPDGVVDMVNSPAHYHQENPMYEPAKVIRAWGLPWALGDAVKYIARAGRKGDRAEDLRKAIWYITDEIDAIDPPVNLGARKLRDVPAEMVVEGVRYPPELGAHRDHDSIDAIRMMEKALAKASMRTEPGMELAMKDEVRVLREIAAQGWVVIRAEHV